jgi:hypothetical protein
VRLSALGLRRDPLESVKQIQARELFSDQQIVDRITVSGAYIT